MKTNFLYFRENGYQKFTYASGNQEFTINGDTHWDTDVSQDTQVKVTVTDISAGTDTVIPDNGKSYSTNVITIAAANANGFDLAAGDIVTIELIPTETTEFALRADAFVSCDAASDTSTVLSFKASNGTADCDTITFTHADDNGATFIKIAKAMASVLNANKQKAGGVVTVFDNLNKVYAEDLGNQGITKMLANIV
tara:strand:+ start:749 stop:1336 length:588 start_codon:yes stop_codon:yes gene_type:complete